MRPTLSLLLVLAACRGSPDETGPGRPDTGVPPDTAPPDTAPPDTGSPDDTGPTPDVPVSGVTVAAHEEVHTILVVTWTQDRPSDAEWIEFSFEDGTWSPTPERARTAGAQREVLLGVPADTEVALRFVERSPAGEVRSRETWSGITGSLPRDLVPPAFVGWDPALTSPEPWILGSVDVGSYWYYGPFYVFILDRQGRVVWYRAVSQNRTALFPRVARDGTHVLYEGGCIYTWDPMAIPSITRETLDLAFREVLELPRLNFTYDEQPDGTLLYDASLDGLHFDLVAVAPDGTEQTAWRCNDWLREVGGGGYWACMSNTVNYDPETDTVLWSMFELDTVVEVDLEAGEVVRQWGQAEGSWAVDPPEAMFDYMHFPNRTAEGTLLLSTHALGGRRQQRAREYLVDDETRTLVQVWSFGESVPDYADYAGEATRLANGNTLVNYGTDGTIREVTPDGEIAWEVDFRSHLVGHDTLVPDLYALNRGP